VPPPVARNCPKCAGEVRDGWRVCPACAAPLEAETELLSAESSSSSSIAEGRFPAGTVLAGRYRILGLIGKGGMGEVYRAHDLILDQPVALKFLAGAKMTEASLARFRNEVRVARQVSHPNVCRVYDLGMVEGLHFLSMEYIDGEDLASLLRRIGRLPQDKAIEFTRKICAGLAVAHERGVLHRDLKPANIMIDGRGHVRITDFGLAALAAEVPLSDLRSGTPAYMSPEQKAGKEVTTRSDIYSLGLVLHEMFTGKSRRETQSSPSELVKDLDPAVERVILRCLEEDPKRRPASALNVAMALPGGDPVAAALAAGETPSPEMVAASGEKEGFSPRTAIACFAGVVVCLVAIPLITGKVGLLNLAPLKIPPDGLAFRAEDILKQLGYAEQPKSTAYGFDCCDQGYARVLQPYDAARRDALLATEQPPLIHFWYRQHQGKLWSDAFNSTAGDVTYNSPASIEPGMIRLILDPTGRLTALEVRPLPSDGSAAATKAPDWSGLFSAAGLDPGRFTPVAPLEVPPMAFDARAAWTGTYAEGRSEQVRVEAASWQAKPVFFDLTGDWRQPANASSSAPLAARLAVVILAVLLFGGGAVVVVRNLRLGRGDRHGASRVAVFLFLLSMGSSLLSNAHVAGPAEPYLLGMALGGATLAAALAWCLYIAVEPFVRRNWPDALISWTRLQAGRLRDPLIASHALIGILIGVAAFGIALSMTSLFSQNVFLPDIPALDGAAYLAATILYRVERAIVAAFAVLVLVVILRLLTRRVWLADVLVTVLIGAVATGPWLYPSVQDHLWNAVGVLALLWGLRRFGLLAMLTYFATNLGFLHPPLSLDQSWYAGRSVVILLILTAVAAWALWVILSAHERPNTETAG
jgi:hypothetical protein